MKRAISQATDRKPPANSTTRIFISRLIIRYERLVASGRECASPSPIHHPSHRLVARPTAPATTPVLRVFAIEAGDLARRLTFDGALLQIRPFVMGELPVAHAELGFYFSIFPIELEDDQRAAFYLRLAVELVDLLPMQQQFADALCGRNFVAGFFVWLDIGVIKKSFDI